MSNKKQIQEDFFSEKNQFNFKQLLAKVAVKWHYFLISLLSCALLSFIYVRYTSPLYKTSSKVFITEDKAPNPADDALSQAFGGQFGIGNNGQAEAEIFRTRGLMEKVVRELKTYITYYHDGNVRKVELYQAAPFKLTLLSSPDSIAEQDIRIVFTGNKINLTGELDFTGEKYSRTVNLYQQATLPGLGKVLIERGVGMPEEDQQYSIKVETINNAVKFLMKKLSVDLPIPMVKIIDLDIVGEVPQKSQDILNKLTDAYVKSTISDKNRIADSTITFIENRLIYVGQELANVEGNVQSFKQQNRITDLSAQATQLITSTKESVEDLGEIETKLNVLNSIEQYLTGSDDSERIVPSGALLEDPSFGALIERYNTIVMEKERSSLSQTDANPYIQNLNVQIASARKDMLSSLRSMKRALEISRQRIESRSNTIAGQVRKVPAVERTYLDLSRQQQIKQDLYVFLLKKREETAISKTSNISNCRIIDVPFSFGPVSPIETNVYGFGLILGIMAPLGLLILKDKMNTTIVSKSQITNYTEVPIIGEIGNCPESKDHVVVSGEARTHIAEQFRALRTNLSFFLKSDEKTVLLTSSMSGEGKSFISLNLATVLAISGKRVVVMEMDLRRPNLSNKLNIKNDNGFTNFIVDRDMAPEKIIKESGIHHDLFVISSGNMPPNPAEIIMSNRTDVLMKYLTEHFDYVIMDAPPVGMVTDAQLLSKFADLTLYVIRQGHTHKEQLFIPQDIYSNKKMKNIALLVNDVKSTGSYGYGYTYAYGVPEEEKNFFRRIFKQ